MAQRDNALKQIKQEISGATRTMTSVPKPLKFLSPHYKTLVKLFEEQTDAQLKVSELATIIM
jgi:26S proteasome regulatory subunit N1